MSSIENLNIDELEEDKRKWKSEASGQYTCNPYFEKLCNDDSAGEFLPFKMIWKASIPPKIQVFLWALAQGKLNSGEVMQESFLIFVSLLGV